jgi:hypothetical protein
MWILALSQEREEVRLSIGRADSTFDGQNHSIDKDCVFTREKRNHACYFIRCSGSTDWETISKRCHYRFAFLKIGKPYGRSSGKERLSQATRTILRLS